jgi:putative peptidoglycan lipid II flippase
MLSAALTAGGAVQLIWLAISCRRAGVSIPLMLPKLGTASKRLFKNIGPGALGAGAGQINLFISNILASTLPTGSISYLFYADRLEQLPLGIVGIAVATTLLPILSRHVENRSESNVRHYTNRAIEFCLLLGLPAAIGLALAAEPIIQVLFEHGAFSHADTIATANALAAYSIGIPGFLLVKVFSAGFFARHDTKTPVRAALIALATNVIVSLLLLSTMKHCGIALSNSIAMWVNAILLFTQSLRDKHPIGDAMLKKRAPRLLFCAAVMAVVTIAAVHYTQGWMSSGHMTRAAMGLAVILVVSGGVYGLFLQITGAMPLRDAMSMLTRKSEGNLFEGKL